MTKCSAENLSASVTANNRLQGYSYDAAGNMTQDNNGTNYAYDPENRISSSAGFTYLRCRRQCVEKSNGSSGTLYWSMSSGIVGESDLSGSLQSEYVFFNGERVARKDFPGGAVSCIHCGSSERYHLSVGAWIKTGTWSPGRPSVG